MSDILSGNGSPINPPAHCPVCPQCDRELDEFAEAQVTFKNGIVAHVLWCPNHECRALFTVQIMGMSQPQNKVLPVTTLPFNPTRKM
jgi:hypothetical protein